MKMIHKLCALVALATSCTASWAVGTTDPFMDGYSAALTDRGYLKFGPLNGGGDRTYAVENNVVKVTLLSTAHNSGDVWWVNNPAGTEQLPTTGTTTSIDVRVNYGQPTLGDYTYRSGPGLYLSDSQTLAGYGDSVASGLELFIGHQDTEISGGKFRVIAYKSTGGGNYRSQALFSADDVWAFGTTVTLKIAYLGQISGNHRYECLYNIGAGDVSIGTLDFAAKLVYSGPFVAYSYYSGAITADVPDWAEFDNFYPVLEYLVPVEVSGFSID